MSAIFAIQKFARIAVAPRLASLKWKAQANRTNARKLPARTTVFFGAWKPLQLWTVFAAWGALLIGAIYMLRAVRNILHGPLAENATDTTNVTDAPHFWRKLPFAILLVSLIVFGCFPSLLTEKIKPSAAAIVDMASRGGRSQRGKSPSGVIVVRAGTPEAK